MVEKSRLTNIKLESVIYNILYYLKEKNQTGLIVGGSVRDAILGIVPKDIDIEVYNIGYDELKSILEPLGTVNLVGKAFGVIKFKPFQSDITYDFSIPRKENKIGVKHQDFEMSFDANMTVKEAAMRRDITINSLAYDPLTHEIHDYFYGLIDLKDGFIRHTSEKFTEDALRILRCLQFQSRFGFQIHTSTVILIREMLKSGEFEKLPKERIFEEWMKWAEKGTHHHLIFKFLRDTELIDFYPELKALKETPQDAIYHPEGDVEIHTELCLKHMDKVIERENITGKEKAILVLSILFHDIGKPSTTEEKEKRGRMTITSEGHEELGGQMVISFLERLGFHEELITPISKLVANHLAGVNISMIDKPSSRHRAVKKLANRLHPANIKQLLYVMEADTNGRGGLEIKIPTGAKELLEIADEINVVENKYEYILMGRHLIEAGLSPSPIFKQILSKSYEAQENGEFSDILGAKEWLNKNLNTFVNA